MTFGLVIVLIISVCTFALGWFARGYYLRNYELNRKEFEDLKIENLELRSTIAGLKSPANDAQTLKGVIDAHIAEKESMARKIQEYETILKDYVPRKKESVKIHFVEEHPTLENIQAKESSNNDVNETENEEAPKRN